MRIEQIFLEIAGRDLEAAKLLLENGFYPQSVFFIEQSVEKTVKSLGLWRKAITLHEARVFGHEAIPLFRKIWEKLIGFAKDTIGDAEIKLDLEEWDRFADNVFRKLERWLKDEEWSKLSGETYSLSKPLESIENAYTEMTVKLKAVESRLRVMEGEKDSQNRSGEIRRLNSQRRIARLSFCFAYLIHMCLVFFPQVSKARYPIDNWNPLDFYNQQTPVIKLAGDFIEYQEKGLVVVKCLYDEVPDLPSRRDNRQTQSDR